MVLFDGDQLIAQVQTIALMCTLYGKNAIQLVYIHILALTLQQERNSNKMSNQPLTFFPIWCMRKRKTFSNIYLSFNFLQLFSAFAVKVNSMGFLTEFFMIHNFSFLLFPFVSTRFFRFTFDDIFIGFSFYFLFCFFGPTIYNFVIVFLVFEW